ncbi:MAG: SprB repeat-containing protein, partial [Bacteroidota bacterium]
DSASFTIDEPTTLAIDVSGTVTEDVDCFGAATGSIDLDVSGGTAPYTYAWSNSATTEDIFNLLAGTYSVTVTDANGCTDEASFTIGEPTELTIDAGGTNREDVDCNGAATGSIDLLVEGGTAPYTYNWSTGQTSEDVSNLTAGTYDVTVTDANDCTDSASFTITEPTSLSIDVAGTTTEDADCNGATTGSIDLVVNGGTPPYTYNWSNGATTQDISNLAAGTYDVTVTDANDCTDEA